MRWLIAFSAFVVVLHTAFVSAQESKGVLLFQKQADMDAMRADWLAGKQNAGVTAILEKADSLLVMPVPLIIEKEKAPASGDKRDYYSIGIYWWPNPLTGGLPYVRRDGVYNPESEKYDRPKLQLIADRILQLARAYWITRDKKYSDKGTEYLRAWFIDEKTRMNPNLQHAQAWPGWTDGSPTGILEGVAFARSAPDGVTMLYESGGLPEDDYQKIREWFSQLVGWMETSAPGKKIAAAKNNHGSWYDMQRTCYHLFLGQTDAAKKILSQVGERRIAVLIEPDGKQPSELSRTKAFDYSCYNLSAITTLCRLGTLVNVDIWHYESPKGASIPCALDFLIPYAKGEKPWPYQQLKGVDGNNLVGLLEEANPVFPDRGYSEAAKEIRAHKEKK